MRLYPSDAFLRFATAVLAGDFDLSTVEDVCHTHSPLGALTPEESKEWNAFNEAIPLQECVSEAGHDATEPPEEKRHQFLKR